MSALRFLVIATSVILGSLPIIYGSCSYRQFRACSFHSDTEPDCPVYKKSLTCLEKLETNCDNTKIATYIASRKNYLKAQKAFCPGLPDGSCYFGRTSICMKRVNYLNPGNETCSKLKKLYQATKQCFNDVKPLCNSTAGIKHIASEMRYFEKRSKQCGVATTGN